MRLLRILLFPFSFLYGLITCMRNKLYDWKFIPSIQYDDVYVISVGNITVGGTGKTPFVEYLARHLSQDFKVAVLSRGYKRTTKGFRIVNSDTPPCETGDEPYQIKRKFLDIVVAVDVDRINGIGNIRKIYPDTQVILLDDAFQYRKIKPNLSILLADYHRPMFRDGMLPGGRLREWACFAKMADFMVITKSPAVITSDEQQEIKRHYARIFSNKIYFSAVRYGDPAAIFPNGKSLLTGDIAQHDVLLLAGIANPKPFEDYVSRKVASLQAITFPDHHAFSEKDISRIVEKWNDIRSAHKILLTTEKDAVRLQQMKIPDTMTQCCYYIPVEIKFL